MAQKSEFFRKLQQRANGKKPVTPQNLPPVPVVKKPPARLLYWADSPTTTTGFGVVSKYLLWGIHQSQRYKIDCLGINYWGDFFDQNKFPYQIIPSKLRDPREPYGCQMFLDAVEKNDYDIVLVMNDVFVTDQIGEKYRKVLERRRDQGRKLPKLVYYYPVDCRVVPNSTSFLELAEAPIAYSDFAVDETHKSCRSVEPRRIYLGTNPEVFKPLTPEQRTMIRSNVFQVNDPETFVIINVNRNSLRKDVAKTILAFSKFHEHHPNSVLYCHMAVVDAGAGSAHPVDLGAAIACVPPDCQRHIRFPRDFNVAQGFPEANLNELYNAADCYISTHNGEGFGLTQVESMCAGTPVVVPNNTVTPELIGLDGERGYVYPCHEQIFIDSSGYRFTGRVADIVDKLTECFNERGSARQKGITDRARRFAEGLSWKNIWMQWMDVFNQVERTPSKINSVIGSTLGAEL